MQYYWLVYIAHTRQQYEILKTVCQQMVPTIGSGRIITKPIITNDGEPIEDPSPTSHDSTAAGIPKFDDGMDLDKRVIQWKLILHQIGKNSPHFFVCACIMML